MQTKLVTGEDCGYKSQALFCYCPSELCLTSLVSKEFSKPQVRKLPWPVRILLSTQKYHVWYSLLVSPWTSTGVNWLLLIWVQCCFVTITSINITTHTADYIQWEGTIPTLSLWPNSRVLSQSAILNTNGRIHLVQLSAVWNLGMMSQ